MAVLALAAGLAGGTVFAATPLASFRDGPPAAVTGGFGEDSCLACHWGDEVNDPGGELRLLGFPKRFEPGGTYALEVVLTRPEMQVAGFQLAVRFEEGGGQAGSVEPAPGEDGRVAVVEEGEVLYAQHLLDGIRPVAPDTARWRVVWTAPMDPSTVRLHVSAVAGDDDESQIGDFVYTWEGPSGVGPQP